MANYNGQRLLSRTSLFNHVVQHALFQLSLHTVLESRIQAVRLCAMQSEDSMAELNFESACELTALIRKRELKPSEAVAHALARVEALNGKLNAFCAMRAERAMAEARAMDE